MEIYGNNFYEQKTHILCTNPAWVWNICIHLFSISMHIKTLEQNELSSISTKIEKYLCKNEPVETKTS